MKGLTTKPAKSLTQPKLSTVKSQAKKKLITKKPLSPEIPVLLKKGSKTPTATRPKSTSNLLPKTTSSNPRKASIPSTFAMAAANTMDQGKLPPNIILPPDNIEGMPDTPKSLLSQSMDTMEKEILMEQIEALNNELSKLRFENELLKRRAKCGVNIVTEEEKRKDELIKKQEEELNELHISFGELNFTYERLLKEHEDYRKVAEEQIANAEGIVRKELEEEANERLKEKELVISDLKQERMNLEQTAITLRQKLNRAEERKATTEKDKAELKKLRQELQETRESLRKAKAEVDVEKDTNGKLALQVKELIQQCEDYEERISKTKPEAQAKNLDMLIKENEELKEDLAILSRERDQLKYEIEEWGKIVAEYEKHSGDLEAEHRSKSTSKKDPNLECLHVGIKEIKDQVQSSTELAKSENLMRKNEMNILLDNQKNCVKSIDELTLLIKSLRDECKNTCELLPSIIKGKGSLLSTTGSYSTDKPVVVIEDLEVGIEERSPRTPRGTARTYDQSFSNEKSATASARKHIEQKREVQHRRARSTAYDKNGWSNLWGIRRRSFAKNLGLAWENMQLLKETTEAVRSKADAYFAQI